MSKFCNIIQILLSQNSCSLIDFSLNSFWYRYASSFQFLGDYQDDRPIDSMGRRKTTIVAIDALDDPRDRQLAAQRTSQVCCILFVVICLLLYFQHQLIFSNVIYFILFFCKFFFTRHSVGSCINH